MPIYEYKCSACGQQQEVMQKMSDLPLTNCPNCGKSSLEKVISATQFQLKGAGWYVTDFKGSATKSQESTSSEGTSDPKNTNTNTESSSSDSK